MHVSKNTRIVGDKLKFKIVEVIISVDRGQALTGGKWVYDPGYIRVEYYCCYGQAGQDRGAGGSTASRALGFAGPPPGLFFSLLEGTSRCTFQTGHVVCSNFYTDWKKRVHSLYGKLRGGRGDVKYSKLMGISGRGGGMNFCLLTHEMQ